MESGQQCCYDRDGHLLTGPNSGGTVDLVAPMGRFGYNIIRHQLEDVIPANYCCKGVYKDVTCGLYYEKRPSSLGVSCE